MFAFKPSRNPRSAERGSISGTFPSSGRPSTQEREHRSLGIRLRELGGVGDAVDLTMSLLDLRSFLLRHFSREEAGDGFFAQVLREAPERERQVGRLKQEHRAIVRQLDALLGLAKQGSGAISETVRAGRDELVAVLMRHEDEENELLQHALQDDFGGD